MSSLLRLEREQEARGPKIQKSYTVTEWADCVQLLTQYSTSHSRLVQHCEHPTDS